MNIQIFGKSKCFDTKKAERYFKERRVKFQAVDLVKFGMSKGELQSVKNAVGLENLVDWDNPDAAIIRYLAGEGDKLEKLFGETQAHPHPGGAQRPPGHGGLLPRRVEGVDVSRGHGGTFLPLEREIFKKCNRCVNKQ